MSDSEHSRATRRRALTVAEKKAQQAAGLAPMTAKPETVCLQAANETMLREAKQFSIDWGLAQDVRRKIEDLNDAIRAAQSAGLCVHFALSSYLGKPGHNEVGEVRIERPGDRVTGLPSVKL